MIYSIYMVRKLIIIFVTLEMYRCKVAKIFSEYHVKELCIFNKTNVY